MTSAVPGLPERLVQQALDGHAARIFPQFYVPQLPVKKRNMERILAIDPGKALCAVEMRPWKTGRACVRAFSGLMDSLE